MKATLLLGLALLGLALLAPGPLDVAPTARADHCQAADPNDPVAAIVCCVINRPEGTPCRRP